MSLVLPTLTDGTATYSFRVSLEGVTFRFDFRWNTTAGAWFFDVYSDEDVLLLAGRKVVLGIPLLARFRDPRLPAGDMNAVDTTGADLEAGFSDLGTRVKLLYFTAAELEAAYG